MEDEEIEIKHNFFITLGRYNFQVSCGHYYENDKRVNSYTDLTTSQARRLRDYLNDYLEEEKLKRIIREAR